MGIGSNIYKWIFMSIDFHHIKRFLLSGGSATLLHYSVMGLLIFMGIEPMYATGIGALFGAVFNYILQYHYTFKSTRTHVKTIGVYSLTVMAGLLSNEFIFVFFYHYLDLKVIVSQLITTSIVTVQNYLMYKYLVFQRK